jgi:predicted dinucleotide-binding enzyme
MDKILIAGFGNIGKFVADEFSKLGGDYGFEHPRKRDC